MHRALAAEDREQPFREPLVGPGRAVRLEPPGPLGWYGLGPAPVVPACGLVLFVLMFIAPVT